MDKRKLRNLINLAESDDFMGTVTRDEAERSGLGRLALAMRPSISATETKIEKESEVTEDSPDATAQLKQDVAAAMDKSGIPAPLGAEPNMNNGAGMGTQNGGDAVHNQDDAYAKGGQTLGMAIPADRRGSSAAPTNKSFGTAPDSPDINSLADPMIRKVFIESHETYPDAVASLVKLGLSLDEADFALTSEDPIGPTLRKIMVKTVEEARIRKPGRASKIRRSMHEETEQLSESISKFNKLF